MGQTLPHAAHDRDWHSTALFCAGSPLTFQAAASCLAARSSRAFSTALMPPLSRKLALQGLRTRAAVLLLLHRHLEGVQEHPAPPGCREGTTMTWGYE